MGKDDALKTIGTLSLREKLKQAEALVRELEKLERKHDTKCRKIESSAANRKLDVSTWFGQEREKLLAAADPEVRKMVEAEGESDA